MQSVQGAEFLEDPKTTSTFNYRQWLKWSLLGMIGAVNGYATVLMYAQGEIPFALLTVFLTALALYIFGSKKTYAHRYIYPGIAGMVVFVIFPLIYTVGLAFTNYSASNQLSIERTQSVLQQRTFLSGKSYGFDLYQVANGHQLVIKDDGQLLATDVFDIANPFDEAMTLHTVTGVEGKKATIKTIIQNRTALNQVELAMPNGNDIRMSGLRKFAAESPLFTLQEDGLTLLNNQTEQFYKPNMEIGYYQPVDANGEFVDKPISPGFVVGVGTANFERVLTDDGIKEPFFGIFVWTIVFAFLAVTLTLALGMVLACIVQWEPLKGSGIYRLLLILPYAVPSFISILIFKGLFNQSFGEINMLLEAMFGIKPSWFSDPVMARVMVVIVNTWLGFPYMMILCMGLLKSIPEDLYEASAIDGAGPIQNFFKITVPMLIKPLTPLLIASFAFNFNNFVMIQLLTSGGPNMVGTSEPAGYTDLLVSYTYRIAFEGGGGQDFGLAGAIATVIFVLVSGMALLNLKFTNTKLEQD
ncbi:maltose ABC transporter permease MalF [Photobacterium aphoticum]|uniref:Maltose/maltodextrin transport system permease protein n=2 Tax=Photobacterium TaxID=657 RepID=A0A0J1JII3_9GAMM|nr:maltose ABC transporter permease MalF [Photobacterium aphoticum]KLV01762.1 maltose transporter membrane protein [Photobacterium aphoticum]PSU58755.1 maltose ABC transporter permease MalF [Photobacterium aphoticum]GHA32221.1 maltose transport system permease protein MalF [Photobacterium aphoticum]